MVQFACSTNHDSLHNARERRRHYLGSISYIHTHHSARCEPPKQQRAHRIHNHFKWIYTNCYSNCIRLNYSANRMFSFVKAIHLYSSIQYIFSVFIISQFSITLSTSIEYRAWMLGLPLSAYWKRNSLTSKWQKMFYLFMSFASHRYRERCSSQRVSHTYRIPHFFL